MKRLFVAAALLLAALPLRAQIPDARVLPAGVLRWAFTPSWKSWDRVLDTAGTEVLLTSLASSDSAGANLFPTLAAAEAAVRSITNNNTYRLTLGAMKTALDADVRPFPLEFAVGLGERLTVSGTLPVVVTRMNATLTLDSTKGNAGWNQNLPPSGNGAGAAQITSLLAQLSAAATQLSQRIAAATATCAAPQPVLTRTQGISANLAALAGTGAGIPPAAAPTAASAAGIAIASAVSQLWTDLVACGVTGISSTLTMPLPAARLRASDVQSVFTEAGLGYNASAFRYTKVTGLGDAELGLRFGVVQDPHARVVLFGGTRLPTGKRDSPLNLIDIAPADGQLDVNGGFEAAFEPGTAIALSLAASYNRQFPDELDRRVSPQERIINAAPVVRVKRDLGDEISLSAFPGIRLSEAFRVYAGATYYRKGADRYSGTPNADSIGVRTEVQATSFTGGIQYRSVGGAKKLPVEAGLTYSAVYTGSGGFVPKATTLTMYLRFYYRLWGGSATTP
ncbi:MAG: hypothetical protein EXR93_11485 [Gemmatimonadetes bacterium]|nr:hypothetical protein [Gemmatimonadota bacterium]